MNISQATKKDIEGVARLFNEYRMFYKREDDIVSAASYIKERIENSESVIFVVQDGDDYIGFTQLYPTYSSLSMKKIWILNDLYVQKRARKKGIGKMLLQQAKEYAKNNGANSLSLSTAVDNLTAQRLYEKNGYKKDTQFFHYELDLNN
ncbi:MULTISPECIES: GNAT family N-acetyltransferase [Niallia]|uniref:GNAT family N-acetyltransferase n=1 Tax=Niallia TaxID=2837506 RepID=UPI00148FCED9|nr:GNAT family N-acetyltransferase [Niallia circulans]QJX62277.1 GNAT family N-acetyltransferase [Niallia circulans]